MNLRSLDLNLLVILDALLREGGVTAAAMRLNLTQPAVSIALNRARQLFGDPLLVRSGAGMRPTPLAEALAPRLADALAEVAALFAGRVFDPATAKRDFLLVTSDLAELLVLPGLVGRLRVAAPAVDLTFRSVESVPVASTEAREGRLDLTIGGMPAPAAPFRNAVLFKDDFVILARADHPVFARDLTAEGFADLPQALVSPQGRGSIGPIDRALAGLGLSRRIALSLTRFAALPAILSDSDLVACVPRALAALPTFAGPVRARPLPFPSPGYALRMIWHQRHDADPAHQWLRSMVQASVRPDSATPA
jgi:DNA-binding transcriptional LysR family regulator